MFSSETKELISYGGGVGVENIFMRDKRDCLVWGWRIFSSQTSEIISYGDGAGTHTIQTSLHYILNKSPRLIGRSLRQSICVRVERVLCFHFLCLSDHMPISGCPYITLSVIRWGGGGDGENFKYPYPNEKPNEILISNETIRWSSSIHIYRGSQNIIDIWSDKHGK